MVALGGTPKLSFLLRLREHGASETQNNKRPTAERQRVVWVGRP